jgi:4-hydroxy-tetrahydrodipicolinate reductase
MKKVVVVGAGGRMGKALVRCIQGGTVPGLKLVGAIDLWDSPDLGRDAGLVAGVGEIGVPVSANLAAVAPGAHVVVDFSGHQGTAGNTPRCVEWKLPMVIGTTGLSEEEKAVVRSASRAIPIVSSPNMSLGVNLLFSLVEQAARVLRDKGYDIEIVERHHRLKKDSPSGTALGLGEAAAAGLGWTLGDVSVHGRAGTAPEARPERQIGFHSVRGGDFVGDHTVLFAGEGECVELSHRATNRDTFAIGALRAALWVVGRKPGLYSMREVLGLG